MFGFLDFQVKREGQVEEGSDLIFARLKGKGEGEVRKAKFYLPGEKAKKGLGKGAKARGYAAPDGGGERRRLGGTGVKGSEIAKCIKVKRNE